MRVQIPFNELVSIVRQLTPAQRAKLQKELETPAEVPNAKSRLRQLLLQGPTFTADQVEKLKETRKSINQWRTKS